MRDFQTWPEVESEVHNAGRWLPLSVGTLFLLIGIIGFLTIGNAMQPGAPHWIAKACTAVFALFGAIPLAWGIRSIVLPAHVSHAGPDVLPDVPWEPVIREGSEVHGHLTHELWEDGDGWQFSPAKHHWRNTKVFLLGFGIPFLVLFAGVLTWMIHRHHNLSWPISALCGITATVVCGGTALLIIGMVMRSSYRRLSRLSIPRNGDALELDSPQELDPEDVDLAKGLKWIFFGENKRQQLTILRELVVAVQLCPWKFVFGNSGRKTTTWAVQGLLVLAPADDEKDYHRLPILLTGDFVGAARIMQRLARTLQIPYLFCADAEGWKAEAIRAIKRPPLRVGGSL